jgi:hydroxyacylglutathione hydrolase
LRRLLFKVLVVIFFVGSSCNPERQEELDLTQQKWIHGSQDCKTNRDPLIQVVQYNINTWILRQNKCIHYEAPFIFLFVGEKQSMLVDTGATGDEKYFPLRQVVDSILLVSNKSNTKLIVAHTHSHDDHVASDEQFKNRSNTEVIGLSWEAIQNYFQLDDQRSTSSIDLGDRGIDVLSVPGHHKTSLAFYDNQTRLLLTGDTFYPGRLYVRDWPAFKRSIKHLIQFASDHKVNYFIGNHIEMTNQKGIDYPIGSTFQPDEHVLPMTMEQLKELDRTLDKLGDSPKHEVHNDFIIYPK